MKFLIAIEPESEHSAFGVVVPDLQGCFSAGDTLEEAVGSAREAIEAHCEVLAEDGEDLPRAAPLAEHQADPDVAGWIWAMVDVPVAASLRPFREQR
jgi:predicted RNase H-like HicB family nuclease